MVNETTMFSLCLCGTVISCLNQIRTTFCSDNHNNHNFTLNIFPYNTYLPNKAYVYLTRGGILNYETDWSLSLCLRASKEAIIGTCLLK